MDKPDFNYYRTVVSTQNDPDILQSELKDLINECVAYIGEAAPSVPFNEVLCASPIPEEIYNDYAVYMGLDDKAKQRTTSENVSDVLDSVARLIKQRIGA